MTLELSGQTVLVTRPREQAVELRSLLEERGAVVLVQPSIEILPPESWDAVDDAVRSLADGAFDRILFSSSNGVRFFLERLDASFGDEAGRVFLDEAQETAFRLARRSFARKRERAERRAETFEEKLDAQTPFLDADEEKTLDAMRRAAADTARRAVELRRERLARFFFDANVSVAAVGPGTADALRDFGVQVDLIPEKYNAEGLVDALVDAEKSLAGKRFLSVRASRGRDVLSKALTALGATVREVVAYRSLDVETPDAEIVDALRSNRVDFGTVASSATAKALARLFGDALARTRWVALSPLTASALREIGVEPVSVAQESTLESLVDAVISAASDGRVDGAQARELARRGAVADAPDSVV
ncbi:MAG: uroporphyrinogen-III synthase [Thermoguttaceae bacterium]|nr:uroporphyrinogen-III synthase [Thermoguttaceae bacterium]